MEVWETAVERACVGWLAVVQADLVAFAHDLGAWEVWAGDGIASVEYWMQVFLGPVAG